jgi:hypothetical protein
VFFTCAASLAMFGLHDVTIKVKKKEPTSSISFFFSRWWSSCW